MTKFCEKCKGEGFIFEEINGIIYSKPCDCSSTEKAALLVQKSNIPERYRDRCALSNFIIPPGPDSESLREALEVAKRYAEEYPVFEEGKPNGLLFMGPCGVGKTHLAVGILNEIIYKKKMEVRFVDLNDLYREIRKTYGGDDEEITEYDILTPLANAPLLVIDELGCVASPWAQDTLLFLISQRYNKSLPTILTTNYLDEPDEKGEESLTDRIGKRNRSRLYEMCRTVLMKGKDYRMIKRW